MTEQTVHFVGSHAEVAHHAAPLQSRMNVRIIDPLEVVGRSKAGDLAIFFSEHFDRFREACWQLKQKNVATLYMIDGVLEWRNAWENREEEPACPFTMRPVLAHKVACIGASQARVLNSWGNANKTEIVGIPRLDRFSALERQRPAQGPFRLLVMTAKCPGFTDEQIRLVLQSLIDVRDWLGDTRRFQSRQIEVVWRLAGDLADRLNVENRLVDYTGTELAEILCDVDAVITTPSTAMLEAMLLDLPVALLDYNNCPQYVSAAWQISSPAHIAPVIWQLCNPPENKLIFQRTQLQDALYLPTSNHMETATDRLANLIEHMLQIASRAARDNAKLVFSQNLLSQPPCGVGSDVGFSHQRVYPDRPEFTCENVLEIQSQLAHSRREINHLHRELAQLKTELDQAHQIFEQIRRHPVAGPMVRIRQKLIDGLNAMSRKKHTIETTSTTPIP